jgi:hypothetical protein
MAQPNLFTFEHNTVDHWIQVKFNYGVFHIYSSSLIIIRKPKKSLFSKRKRVIWTVNLKYTIIELNLHSMVHYCAQFWKHLVDSYFNYYTIKYRLCSIMGISHLPLLSYGPFSLEKYDFLGFRIIIKVSLNHILSNFHTLLCTRKYRWSSFTVS